MTCANCAGAVERTLTKKVPGVVSAQVNLALETATIEYDPRLSDVEATAAAVTALQKLGIQPIMLTGAIGEWR